MPPGPAAMITTTSTSGKEAPHKHSCPQCWGGTHICIGPITTGCPTVLIQGKPAARATDQGNHAACCGSPPGAPSYQIVAGSPTVFIGTLPAARANDPTLHCGMFPGTIDIASCCPTVQIA